jgi:tetratricopeptide (TPR) repeat protein
LGSRRHRAVSIDQPVARTNFLRHIAVAAILAFLVFFIYSGSLENGFVWDDHEQILRNPNLLGSSAWTALFASSVWGFQHPGEHARDNQYRPMQMLTYRMTGEASGFNARPFHWVSLLFHFAACLLFYAVVYRLTQSVGMAAAAAFLFAAHPIHSEAVDWISSLGDLGCAVFFLLSFLLYLRGVWVGSVAAFGVALLWKEMAAMLPVVIAAHMLLFGGWRRLRVTVAYWVVFAGYLLLRFHALGTLYAAQRDWVLSPFEYALTVVHLAAMYWWKLIWPLPLMGYHVFVPVASLGDARFWAAILFLGGMIAAGVYVRRGEPLIAFSVAWVFLTLVPVLNLYALGRNVFAERYLYIPSAGFCLLVVLLGQKALSFLPGGYRLWVGAGGLALITAFYGEAAIARGPVWKDNMTFFSRSLEESPDSAFLNNSVAEMLRAERRDPQIAAQHYTEAIALAERWNPPEKLQISIAYVGLAYLAAQASEFDGALRDLDLAEAADPLNNEVRVARGSILTQAGRWAEAKKALLAVLERNPNDEVAVSALGIVAWQGEHAYPEAVGYMERALRLPASDIMKSSIHENLGAVYCEMERCADALPHFQAAIQLDPGDPKFYVNFGTALRLSGRSAEAKEQFLRALQIDSGYEPARSALARLEDEARSR